MPAYLCHGFRWHRQSIRVFVVVQDLDDAAPEWIIGRRSATALLNSFYNIFDFLPRIDPGNRPLMAGQPHQRSFSLSTAFTAAGGGGSTTTVTTAAPTTATDDVMGQDAWSAVRLLEEYDPARLDEVSRPYAYVADYVVRIDLSVSIVDEMTRYEERLRASSKGGAAVKTATVASASAEPPPPPLPPAMAGPHSDETGRKRSAKEQRKAGWLEKLRDQLQRGEDIRWYVVANGDEERPWEYGENGRGRGRGESVSGFVDGDEEEEEEEEGGLEAEYNRALEARRREQEERPRQQQHQQQQQQQQQPHPLQTDTTPRQRPQPRFNGAGAGRSVDEHHRERERQRLRQQFGGLDIDSDGEGRSSSRSSSAATTAATPPPQSRFRSRSRGKSNKGLPPPPLEPLPPEQQQQQQQQQQHGASTPKMSMDGYPRPPKTPKSGGFRRLFGRGHGHKGSTAETP